MDCEFTHTAMTGLFISMASNALVDRNVFTDIGDEDTELFFLPEFLNFDIICLSRLPRAAAAGGLRLREHHRHQQLLQRQRHDALLEHQRHLRPGQQVSIYLHISSVRL